MRTRLFSFWAMLVLPWWATPMVFAAADPDATVVKLRKSCQEVGGTVTLNNCFTDTTGADGLQVWLDTLRTSTAPLSIEIGAGTFGAFVCTNKNNISLKGSGPDVTILKKVNGTEGAITVTNCASFNVQDLTVSGFLIGVTWAEGGSSRWTNVTVEPHGLDNSVGTVAAWLDAGNSAGGCTDTNKPVHYWFNSRLRGGNWGYVALCSENWFFGSEIMSTGNGGVYPGQTAVLATGYFPPLSITAKPEIHIYGSVIRVEAQAGKSYLTPTAADGDFTNDLKAVVSGKNAEVHIHGTGIDVIGNELPNDIGALVSKGGMIHAAQSAFTLRTPNPGKVYRILNNAGHVHAPYLWEQHATPPNIISETGADMAVVTDGAQPSLVIYSSTCASKWFDTGTKACRP